MLKSIGIVRRVDELGRIVIPMELRRSHGIDIKDALEIYVENEYIVLVKYKPTCIFCGSAEDVKEYQGKKNICAECMGDIKGMADKD